MSSSENDKNDNEEERYGNCECKFNWRDWQAPLNWGKIVVSLKTKTKSKAKIKAKKRQRQLLWQRQNISLIGGTGLRWILGKFEVSSTQTWRIRDSSSGSYPPIRPHVYLCLKRHTNYKIYLNLKQWHYLIHSKISHSRTAWREGNVIFKN